MTIISVLKGRSLRIRDLRSSLDTQRATEASLGYINPKQPSKPQLATTHKYYMIEKKLYCYDSLLPEEKCEIKTLHSGRVVSMHAFNPSTRQEEAGGSL